MISFMAVSFVRECLQTHLDHQKSNRKGGAECAQDPCAQVSELYLLENDTIFDLHRMLGKDLQKKLESKGVQLVESNYLKYFMLEEHLKKLNKN